MSQIELLNNLASRIASLEKSELSILNSLHSAGILDKSGEFTPEYKHLNIKDKIEQKNIEIVGENLKFIKSKANRQLLVGASSTGRTYSAMTKLHLYCVKHPGTLVFMVRKALAPLRNTAVKTLNDVIKNSNYKSVRILGETRPIEFIYENGSRIKLGLIDDRGTLLGIEADFIYFNGLYEGLTENEFAKVMIQARKGFRQVIIDTDLIIDKNGERTHWMYSLPEKYGFEVFNPTLKDNPAMYGLTERGKEHINNLKRLPEHLKENLVKGEWK